MDDAIGAAEHHQVEEPAATRDQTGRVSSFLAPPHRGSMRRKLRHAAGGDAVPVDDIVEQSSRPRRLGGGLGHDAFDQLD